MKAQDIRKRFTDFFIKHGHEKIASSSLVPHDDPTLLFNNAGMNQFKDNFTGKSNPKNKRAVTIQKCVRAGGKHNDLENVGFTARHHTFFEMLGNFSFGDYFKSEAIDFAWKFLTEELKIPKDKLYITVHDSDDEALEIWHKEQGIPKDRIFKKGDKDNFWEMGEFGPCGPCSEIFYDHGEKYTDKSLDPKKINDLLDDELRYVEIWNLVFMQFEKTPKGKFDLPKPSIDTGAGLERIATLMQGKYWNYDCDLFDGIISSLEEFSSKTYTDNKYTSSFRVIGDHIRAASMLITDGVIPSNEGRGYVLRRIIRRAVRHIRELGISELTLHRLVPVVFESLGMEYTQNQKEQDLAIKYLKIEEEKFLETLDTGIKFLTGEIKKMKTDTLSGHIAFKLYDTYGFPIDLTEVILREKNLKLDEAGFDKSMTEQKERSRKSWKGGALTDDNKKVFYKIKEDNGITKFTGYEKAQDKGKLLFKEKLDDVWALVFDQTPFYAESGGQAGDQGSVEDVLILDTQKPVEDLHVLYTDDPKNLEVGKTYTQTVDSKKRELTKRNHSATHLLQSALIKTLGTHIKQAGSHVTHERLRFDFTHPSAVTKDELKEVNRLVNEYINSQYNVSSEVMDKEKAMNSGAIAMFGEKYGDSVRVITMGDASVEFCGGTHVSNTADIGLFYLTSESSLSSGVRRIEAVTSSGALSILNKRSQVLSSIESSLNAKEETAADLVENLQAQVKKLNKEKQLLKDKLQGLQSGALFDNPESLGTYVFKAAKAPEGSDLRKLSDDFISQYPKGILLLYGENKGKISALLRVHKSNKDINCSKILGESLKSIDGRGGGRADMAQGSAEVSADLGHFVKITKELIGKNL